MFHAGHCGTLKNMVLQVVGTQGIAGATSDNMTYVNYRTGLDYRSGHGAGCGHNVAMTIPLSQQCRDGTDTHNTYRHAYTKHTPISKSR